ncbi:thiopeptide-type bacteriocin biosynthesis protein [Chitinophaga niastensis]|uniref:Thiopeptide-type bacteriocin biosynthesis protein n=1 Tax=Chitinophaga niastensis TaxID=536980 RepID=A0A2P8HP44_CHINA|nr:lantibiotic dehydratase [Chitinophaga niastensis]PSL47992.1 thiopeptide-type bacteriocin biosynthesis protein [Chitinophaga niastensis]
MTQSENFYIVRTPLLSISLPDQLKNVSNTTLAAAIKEIFQDAYLQEAIYIASPELYQELEKWQQGSLKNEKEINKLAAALFRYLLRMSSRCTPYGLFAGCATGAPGNHSAITLAGRQQHKKHCRLDMNYVAELAAAITAIPEIKEQLLYFPNNSLYKIGSRYRYAAYTIKNKIRNYYLTSVNSSNYLDKMLRTAEKGATLPAIRNSIVNEEDNISAEEAAAFTDELLQNQLLVSELEPTVTGEEFFSHLVQRLDTLQHTAAYQAPLHRIQELLRDQQAGIEKYTTTHSLVTSIVTDTSNKDLVQTDLFLSTTQNTLSSTIINDITSQTAQLWKLARANNNSDLQNFCNAFRQRYEEREIPLSLALDTESGIGYADHSNSNTDHTPLVDGIYPTPEAKADTITRNKIQAFQAAQLQQCLRQQHKEIVITDQQLEDLKDKDVPTLPYSTYLMGSLLGSSATAIDAGDYLFDMTGCSGPSAANLLGRFCHGDEALTDKVLACLKAEEANDPDKIYAEIIHLPEARTGNILMRPRLRDYEIVYLANSHTPDAYQIPLADLMIRVQNNKIVLRSKRLNKIIIPRLSTAHNFRNGLPVYKFLCDLQYQDYHAGIGWQWQLPTEEVFLPQVRYGKIILSKCTWILRKKDYPALSKEQTKPYREIFDEIRHQLQLPRYVVIMEGDNELLIDLENEAALHLLAATLLKKDQVTLQEFLSTEENCWITGPAGKHTNEFIIPLKNVPPETNKPSIGTVITSSHEMPARQFIPGSEWLYVKLYCGTRSAENILKEVLCPLTSELIAAGVIDKWFFLRYTDPEHHLRIRFHNDTNKEFWKEVLDKLYNAMQHFADKDMVYRIQTDTYEREIERYGANTMAFSETIFYYDSAAVINIVNLLDEEEGENYRWLLAIRGVDMLLNDFGYSLTEKTALLKMLQKGFFDEFGGGKPLLLQLNDKYREEMRKVSGILDPSQDEENGIEEAIALFTIRSQQIKTVLAEKGIINRDDLLSSYIHMFLNRILLSNQRKHELVIYHFLSRYYDSMTAILKKQAKEPVPAKNNR